MALDIKKFRNKLGLNQSQFWAPLGVTQSGGSRYESGRNIPVPVRMLILLTYQGGTLDQLNNGKLLTKAKKGL